MQFVLLQSALHLPATLPNGAGSVVQPGVRSWLGRFFPKRGNRVQNPSTGGMEGGKKVIRTERGSQAVQRKKLWVIESSSKFIGRGGSYDTPLTGWSQFCCRFADWLGGYHFKNNREMIWDCSLTILFKGNWEPERNSHDTSFPDSSCPYFMTISGRKQIEKNFVFQWKLKLWCDASFPPRDQRSHAQYINM